MATQVSREYRMSWLLRPINMGTWFCLFSLLIAIDLWRRGTPADELLPALLVAMALTFSLLFWGLLRLVHAARRN
jgi:hypothetical protein